MKGFTLLEVLIALAIMAGVVLTVLGSLNFHLSALEAERDTSVLTLLARYRLTEMELQHEIPARSEGTFEPSNPGVSWRAELFPTKLPTLKKLVLTVRRVGGSREVALERYILK